MRLSATRLGTFSQGRSVTGPELIDPEFGSVSLLLHGDGSNGSTTITDSSPTPKTVTAFGNAQISTAQSKFGGSSIAFDGNGDYLNAGSSNAFAMGTGDFTVEAFVRVSSFTNLYQTIFRTRAGSVNSATGFSVGVLGTGTPLGQRSLCFYTNSAIRTADDTILLNTWHHIACCRSSGSILLFIDGSLLTTGSSTLNFTDQVCLVGAVDTNAEFFTGHIDDLRVTKGIARYTANFTPPTAPFPDI